MRINAENSEGFWQNHYKIALNSKEGTGNIHYNNEAKTSVQLIKHSMLITIHREMWLKPAISDKHF